MIFLRISSSRMTHSFLAFVALAFLLMVTPRLEAGEPIKVFCWQLSPQAEAVVSGLERVLDRSLPVVDAGGDYANGEIMLKYLAEESPRLLVVLGTQALALTAPKIKKIPVVFGMVADPYHTGAAYNKANPDDHQENITGIASPPPLEEAIRQALKIFPAKRHWGMLYDPREGASVELKQDFDTLAQQNNLKLTALPITPGTTAAAALTELSRQGVQVVFLPPDQFSRQYAKTIAAMGQDRRFVVVNGNPRIDNRGAVLTVTLNYEAVGEQLACLARRVVGGEKPRDIPVRPASPAQVEVDESLLNAWAGYPPGK